MKDLYITSTLHSDWNVTFNPKLCSALEKKGILCYLPQRDTNQKGSGEEIFQQNINGIKNSGKLLCIASNESVNWGGEVGFAYGIHKKIMALKNKDHEIPLMLRCMINEFVEVDNLNDIESYIDRLAEKTKK